MTHVLPTHVDPTASAELAVVAASYVHARQVSSALHADRNVPEIRIVQWTRLASIRSVWIPVLAYVESTPTVLLFLTHQFAYAGMVTVEILSLDVMKKVAYLTHIIS